MGDRLGCIEKEFLADIILINLDGSHLTPIYDIYSHLVYSVRASDVKYVMVNGRLVLDKGAATLCSEKAVLAKAREWSDKVRAYNSSR